MQFESDVQSVHRGQGMRVEAETIGIGVRSEIEDERRAFAMTGEETTGEIYEQ